MIINSIYNFWSGVVDRQINGALVNFKRACIYGDYDAAGKKLVSLADAYPSKVPSIVKGLVEQSLANPEIHEAVVSIAIKHDAELDAISYAPKDSGLGLELIVDIARRTQKDKVVSTAIQALKEADHIGNAYQVCQIGLARPEHAHIAFKTLLELARMFPRAEEGYAKEQIARLLTDINRTKLSDITRKDPSIGNRFYDALERVKDELPEFTEAAGRAMSGVSRVARSYDGQSYAW